MELIELSGWGKPYPGAAAWSLRHVVLTIRPGEVYGLIGENGAGKTTLIRLLLGLIRPSAGRVAPWPTRASLSRSFWCGRRPGGMRIPCLVGGAMFDEALAAGLVLGLFLDLRRGPYEASYFPSLRPACSGNHGLGRPGR